MSGTWAVLVVAALGCYALKLAGVSLPAAVLEHPTVQRVAELLPVAMLAALVVVDLGGERGSYAVDGAQLAGVAAGAVALLLGRGLLAVFVVAVLVTAGLRVLG